MMREYPKWRNFLLGQLARREAAIDYLHITLEEYQADGDTSFFLKEIQTVVEAQGGIAEVAKRASMDPQTLSKILSSEETLHLDTFATILKGLGCRLSIERIKDEEKSSSIELTGETEVPKFANAQTQLAESDSTS